MFVKFVVSTVGPSFACTGLFRFGSECQTPNGNLSHTAEAGRGKNDFHVPRSAQRTKEFPSLKNGRSKGLSR